MLSLAKIILFFILSLLLTACSHPLPKLQDSNGKVVQFSDYHGKWLVINYWATWCKPCYQEMPELNAFYKAHKNNVMMFGVSFDQAPADQLPLLIKKIGAKFPTLTTDPAKQLGIAEISGLPMTFIFDLNGKLKKVLQGEQTQKTLEGAIK